MRIFLLAFVSLLLSSCAVKVLPFKGTYPQLPIVTTTDKSFNDVWDKLIDLFAQNGLSIKIIDRSSGLIISSGRLSTTCEKSDGSLMHPSAYVCVPKIHDPGRNRDVPINGYTSDRKTGELLPLDVNGEWNVRIKSVENKTSINVNLVNLSYVFNSLSTGVVQKNLTEYKSTGVFEKMIAGIIK